MKDYRSLVVWQLADRMRRDVYTLVQRSPASRDLAFADQLRRAAGSVSANIVEGFRRFGAAEFARYLEIAFSSSGEVENWLEDGLVRGHWRAEDIHAIRMTLRRLDPALLALMGYLRSPEAKHRSRRV